MSLTSAILAHAHTLGFDRAAVLPVGPPRYAAQFAAWLAAGHHGEMAYLAARAAARLDPARMMPGAASMIVVAVNYNPGSSPQPHAGPPQGRIARYARWPDYHEILKPKLFALDAFIREQTGRGTPGKAFVDSAPVLERDFAEQAGLGFIGRNTCLITPGLGSWTFLAGLLAKEDLSPDPTPARGGELNSPIPANGKTLNSPFPANGETLNSPIPANGETLNSPFPRREGGWGVRCGRCTRCLDTCPTRAFVAPHVLDARRCTSYLTIELRGPIPRDLRPLMGDWVFGCDVCQEVCPYNRGSRAVGIEALAGLVCDVRDRLKPRLRTLEGSSAKETDLGGAALPSVFPLTELLALDESAFRACFRGTPVLRAKRRGLVRNACVAAGNSRDPALIPALTALLADPEPLVRGHAAWALGRIGGAEAKGSLINALALEADSWVQEEIASAFP